MVEAADIGRDEWSVKISVDRVELEGDLAIPAGARGVVLFAHGSGSSRHSPRNRFVAEELQRGGLSTLLIDLLTAEEERLDVVNAELRFDIPLLARRLVGITDWLAQDERARDLRIGYFGSSTGAGAALLAAAERPDVICAIVSRGGRPDLAGDSIWRVKAPTLFIVGGRDVEVLDLNQRALMEIRADKRLEVVPSATHLFEEAGALEEVARCGREWFECYLAPSALRLPHGEPVSPGL